MCIVSLALLAGWLWRRADSQSSPDAPPAGFARGLLHGALMPCAMPQLLLGNDVPIYALRNTGVPYKLGYTVGVNVCGALFFGLLYRRLNRHLRTRAQKTGPP